MAPSSGHLLVPKALRAVKFAIHKATSLIRSKFPTSTTSAANASLQPIPIRITRHPIHPIAALRQSRSQNNRWFSTSLGGLRARQSSEAATRPLRSSLPASKVNKNITRSGAAPFASSLRPNLTGGALPRTAGGYTLGGVSRSGVRHFSHTPASQAQVVNNVSAAVRAFWLSGQKANYDGIDGKTGEKRWKAVSDMQAKASKNMNKAVESKNLKGTTLEFRLSPTITTLSSLSSSTATPAFSASSFMRCFGEQTLGTEGLLDCLAIDFARALKDLAAILADLKRLSTLGDLPLSLSTSQGNGLALKVHFPGCDAQAVTRLCDEAGVQRGVIREDEGWRQDKDAEIALLFPFAPSRAESDVGDDDHFSESRYFSKGPHRQVQEQVDWKNMLSPSERTTTSPRLSTRSVTSLESYHDIEVASNPWLDNTEGYESLGDSDYEDENDVLGMNTHGDGAVSSRYEEYEGLEGIYKFLSECDNANARR